MARARACWYGWCGALRRPHWMPDQEWRQLVFAQQLSSALPQVWGDQGQEQGLALQALGQQRFERSQKQDAGQWRQPQPQPLIQQQLQQQQQKSEHRQWDKSSQQQPAAEGTVASAAAMTQNRSRWVWLWRRHRETPSGLATEQQAAVPGPLQHPRRAWWRWWGDRQRQRQRQEPQQQTQLQHTDGGAQHSSLEGGERPTGWSMRVSGLIPTGARAV
jgi:hypothetical protein